MIKLLMVADDIRYFSGVANQARMLLKGLLSTGNYEIMEIGSSTYKHPPKLVEFEGIQILPTVDHDDPNIFRSALLSFKPDVVVVFGDPRFFHRLFLLDRDIRTSAKFILWHAWDNAPVPYFNRKFYESVDQLVMISNFSYQLIKPFAERFVPIDFIPHGYDSQEFFPLPVEERNKEINTLLNVVGFKALDKPFFVGWNNRNQDRKRPGTVLEAFGKFQQTHPDALLLLHTLPKTIEGIDIITFLEETAIAPSSSVIFFPAILPSQAMNSFYNIADVTLNIAFNEGFGLSVGESLTAGTPGIVVSTGGMSEQMTDGKQVFGELLPPSLRNLSGTVAEPYLYCDYVSVDEIVSALERVYNNKDRQALGLAGREFITRTYSKDMMIAKWNDLLQKLLTTPTTYVPFSLTKVL